MDKAQRKEAKSWERDLKKRPVLDLLFNRHNAKVRLILPVCFRVNSSKSSSHVPRPPGATMSPITLYAIQNLRVKK